MRLRTVTTSDSVGRPENMINTENLGAVAAEVVQYSRVPMDRHQPRLVKYTGKSDQKLLKHQFRPELSIYPNTIRIRRPNYEVVFYLHDGGKTVGLIVDGVGILGWPDDDAIERVMTAWDIPSMTMTYRSKIQFLTTHPEYQKHLPGKTQKKMYPSQVDL